MWHGCARCPAMTATNRDSALMDGTPRYIVMAALIAVSLVLLAGLWNMLRGTNPNLSQTLMRWRVGLQFVAVAILMLLVYLWRS